MRYSSLQLRAICMRAGKKVPVVLASGAGACYTREKRRAARFFKTYKLSVSN